MKTVEVCRCHGITGSCNVKTCKNITVEYAEVAKVMPAKYDSAIAVACDETIGELKSVGPEDDPTDKTLVYSCDTPYLCERNVTLGIPGTSGRECIHLDRTAPNSYLLWHTLLWTWVLSGDHNKTNRKLCVCILLLV